MLRTIVILGAILGVLAGPRIAAAGMCDDESARETVKEVEAFAKTGKGTLGISTLCLEQSIVASPKLTKRLLAACTTILVRDPKQGQCVMAAITLGEKKLGAIDLFLGVAGYAKLDPYEWHDQATELYLKLDDPRASVVLLAAWKKALENKKRANSTSHTWLGWWLGATAMFEKHGGADEKAFLEEQLKTAKDKKLVKAIDKAIAAIAKR
jgi:hypothetical protein